MLHQSQLLVDSLRGSGAGRGSASSLALPARVSCLPLLRRLPCEPMAFAFSVVRRSLWLKFDKSVQFVSNINIHKTKSYAVISLRFKSKLSSPSQNTPRIQKRGRSLCRHLQCSSSSLKQEDNCQADAPAQSFCILRLTEFFLLLTRQFLLESLRHFKEPLTTAVVELGERESRNLQQFLLGHRQLQRYFFQQFRGEDESVVMGVMRQACREKLRSEC